MNDQNTNNTIQLDVAHKSLVEALKISFRLLQVAMILVVLGFLCSGIFVVKQHESGLVLRFGNIIGTPADRVLGPGLHWAWPYPIDQVITISTGRILSLEIDDFWYFEKNDGSDGHRHGQRSRTPDCLRPGLDGYMICGDVNLAHARWTLRYQIVDPYSYYKNIPDEKRLLRFLFSNAVISTVSTQTVDQTLRTGIEEFRRQVELKTQELLLNLGCGIKLQRVDIDRITPPRQVQQAFDDVIQAEQEHSQKINEAKTYAEQTVNQAKGRAATVTSEAKAYKTNTIEEAKADASYFSEILDEYNNNPEIFTFLAHQQAIRSIMNTVDDKFIFYDTDSQRQLRIQLNRNPKPLR